MLNTKTIQDIQEILKKLSQGEEVTLEERLYIQKAADQDQSISSWLRKSLRLQKGNKSSNAIDTLINDLDIEISESSSINSNPDPDDLGNWFMGAPSWVARS